MNRNPYDDDLHPADLEGCVFIVLCMVLQIILIMFALYGILKYLQQIGVIQ